MLQRNPIRTLAQIPLGLSRHVSARLDTWRDKPSGIWAKVVMGLRCITLRYAARSLSTCSTCRTCRVVSRRDVTSRVEFGLITVIKGWTAFGGDSAEWTLFSPGKYTARTKNWCSCSNA